MKTIKIIGIIWLLIVSIWTYFVLESVKQNKLKKYVPTKTDSLTYQIKVRDSIIYDLYQENKRLKLQQQNFQ